MKFDFPRLMLGVAAAALALVPMGCSSGSSNSNNNNNSQPQNGTVNVIVSDDPTEDWATIGVRVLSISLTPQSGGSPVAVYTAPSPAPYINLLQLDQLSEILGNASVTPGTYTSATITISGNPGDVLLIASADPSTGFPAAAGASIPSSQIQILGTTGSAGSLTVPVQVNLAAPLVVTVGQSNALNLEFNLAHPAFIVAHVPAGSGTTMWAVNFNPCLRHRRIFDITSLILRHHYGTVTAVSLDNSTLTFDKDYPVYPPTTPETEITSSNTLNVEADSANGTLYYDVDNPANNGKIKDFSSISSTIVGKYIRVAARYQVDGSLIAVRLWASTSFNSVWISPEGHVLHVDTTSNTLVVDNELGIGVPLTVNGNTLFYFRTPSNAQTDANSIGQGPAFLSNLVRGFKVHASVVDALAAQLVASSIDIEIARFGGTITSSNLNNFTYTGTFHDASDDYTVQLAYISTATANGNDPSSGSTISGFEWWNFTFPTMVDSGTNAISDFVNATDGTVSFGGTVGSLLAAGGTYATWNDPNAQGSWAAPQAVLMPTNVPFGTAATSYSSGSFTLAVPGGTQDVTVTVDTTTGSGTLVYQVNWGGSAITITPVDVTTTAGQNTLSSTLLANTPVKVYGIPQSNDTIKCYVLTYFTGFAQATTD